MEKPAPIIKVVETSGRVKRHSFGLIWKSAVLLAVLFVISLILMLPMILTAQEEARRQVSSNNLKQIALAIHNYHSTFKQLPRAYYLTDNGDRTLSWRVAITPFMNSSPIFDRYHGEEAWDSPANMDLASAMPRSFHGPWNQDKQSRETGYLVITGPGTLFEDGQDNRFEDCTDGLSNTILTVEVKNSGIHWTEPRDLDIRKMIMQINSSNDNGVSAPWKKGAQVGMADGSVKFLPRDLLDSTLRAMITRNGREQVQIPVVR